MMKISVITVAFNAIPCIEKTIKSVIEQDYQDFEYIVIDGKSTDGTVDLIRHYLDKISYFISEPDSGIYNAMNKAVLKATGDFCIFMNAGDSFVSNNVLSKVSSYLDKEYTVVLGNKVGVKNNVFFDYDKSPEEISFRNLYIGSLSHQASFINTDDLLNHAYDEKYRLVSDWKFWLEVLILDNKKYKGIDVDVCFFNKEGLTYKMAEKGRMERKLVLQELFPERILLDYEKTSNHNIFKFLLNIISNKIKYIYLNKKLKIKYFKL